MRPFQPMRVWLLGAIVLGPTAIRGAQSSSADDQAAFRQARAITEPTARVEALQTFIAQHPGGALARRAADLELQTLLQSFPERTAAIHTLAAAAVQSAAPGLDRWSEEARQADGLASAGPTGADLADARVWARDAVAQMTEDAYRRQMRATELKYKLPALSAAQRRADFARTRASFLNALANVELREGDTAAASRNLAEAARLDPYSSETSSLGGQAALLRHENGAALADFEHAEAEGDLRQPWLSTMVALYRQQLSRQRPASSTSTAPSAAASTATGTPNGPEDLRSDGGDDVPPGLEDEIDALYARLFPPPYALPPRQLPAGGHTVLLELFTGSGCEPCAAPDLAVESLLGTYTRADLAVLEYDQHIPRPDPLANPDSAARAAAYHLETTPEAFLDGEELPVVGASRADVENVVVSFADAIEDRAAESSPWHLSVAVARGPEGTISAGAKLEQAPLATVTSRPAASSNAADSLGSKAPLAVSRRPPLVHFALVEDHVRYGGENGIRFHRMVVRALAAPRPATPLRGADPGALPVAAGAEASFRPAEIESRQLAYLNSFEKGNDRFGEVQFRAKPVAMRPDQLAIVAWLEDAGSHAILQAASAAVPKP